MKSVVFITRALPHYRLAFHDQVRIALNRRDVHYRLCYSGSAPAEQAKADEVVPDWAEKVPAWYFGRSERAIGYQGVLSSVRGADLVVVGQHGRHLHTYCLIVGRWLRLTPRLAFFGHGRGYQAKNRAGLAERVKRFWASKVDWWFAYTQSGADAVVASGFARDRITVFNNAIDTSAIRLALTDISETERDELRQTLLHGSRNVGVYVGGLYGLKRIDFLIEAAERVRALVPDFQLLIIGGGEDAGRVTAAAAQHAWIHYMGPKFGREKSMLASLGRVFLMPGLVGLAVLDAFAYATPMVTTALSYHSPEFDYLRNGENGVIVPAPDDAQGYAMAVAEVLLDDDLRERLNRNAALDAQTYTIEQMAERFVAGVLNALEV